MTEFNTGPMRCGCGRWFRTEHARSCHRSWFKRNRGETHGPGRRIYEVQRHRSAAVAGEQVTGWRRFHLRDLPRTGPGSVIAAGDFAFQSLRAHVLDMRPGEIIYLGMRRRIRVREV